MTGHTLVRMELASCRPRRKIVSLLRVLFFVIIPSWSPFTVDRFTGLWLSHVGVVAGLPRQSVPPSRREASDVRRKDPGGRLHGGSAGIRGEKLADGTGPGGLRPEKQSASQNVRQLVEDQGLKEKDGYDGGSDALVKMRQGLDKVGSESPSEAATPLPFSEQQGSVVNPTTGAPHRNGHEKSALSVLPAEQQTKQETHRVSAVSTIKENQYQDSTDKGDESWMRILYGDAYEAMLRETARLDDRPLVGPGSLATHAAGCDGKSGEGHQEDEQARELAAALSDESAIAHAATCAARAALKEGLRAEVSEEGQGEEMALFDDPVSQSEGSTAAALHPNDTDKRDATEATQAGAAIAVEASAASASAVWVPASRSMAPSWWALEEQPNEPGSPAAALAALDGIKTRDTENKLVAVTEFHDMRSVGMVLSANVVAYRHQVACEGFYNTMIYMKKMPSLYGLVCSLGRLTAFAEKAALVLKLPVRSRFVKALSRISSAAAARKHVIELSLAIRKHFDAVASRQNTLNLGLLLNMVMEESTHLRPLCASLITVLTECAATMPYTSLKENGFELVPRDKTPRFTVFDRLNEEGAEVLLPAEAPVAFSATVRPPPTTEEGVADEERWRQPLYEALTTLWFFSIYMYHLGDLYEDRYKFEDRDNIYPRPWTISYLGSPLWTEWVPFHDAVGNLSPKGEEAVRKYRLKTGWRRPPMGIHKRLYVDVGPDSPGKRPGVLRPYNVDRCERDSTFAQTHATPLLVLLERRVEEGAPRVPSERPGEFSEPDSGVAGPAKGGDAHDNSQARAHYQGKMHRADAIWIFRGTCTPKEWTLNSMFQAIQDPIFSERGLVHQGFSSLFHQSARRPLTRFVARVSQLAAHRSAANPYVVVVTGHSLGGALTQLATWFLARNLKSFVESGQIVVYGVAFGSPAVGDVVAYQEIEECGARIIRVRTDLDPVPFLAQTHGISKINKDKNEVVLHVNDMSSVNLWRPDGTLEYTGLVWVLDAAQPFRKRKKLLRFFASRSASHLVRTSLNPLCTHLQFLACALTIMSGKYTQYGWASLCVCPLLTSWPLFPAILTPESEFEANRVHTEVMPAVMKRLEHAMKDKEKWLQDKLNELKAENFGSASRL
ncbi:lipase [Cystoisospora suis]|uniref:Lipase n=1 Tax=Cystoisospora suis TaxID=483139 RepID=A0A2C6KUS0_9APIC|nr:lipase [Cystoisospora suis]